MVHDYIDFDGAFQIFVGSKVSKREDKFYRRADRPPSDGYDGLWPT